jgi:hypothetical protein
MSIFTKRFIAASVACILALTACGSRDDSASNSDQAGVQKFTLSPMPVGTGEEVMLATSVVDPQNYTTEMIIDLEQRDGEGWRAVHALMIGVGGRQPSFAKADPNAFEPAGAVMLGSPVPLKFPALQPGTYRVSGNVSRVDDVAQPPARELWTAEFTISD